MVQTMLAAKFPSTSKKIPVSLPSQKAPTNPKKIAQFQKVQLMKMRHRAEPGDPKDSARSVPLNQRLHVTVKTHDNPVQEKTLWFHKVSEVLGSLQDGRSSSAEQSIVAGKALDLISTQLGLSRSESSVRVIHSVFLLLLTIMSSHISYLKSTRQIPVIDFNFSTISHFLSRSRMVRILYSSSLYTTTVVSDL